MKAGAALAGILTLAIPFLVLPVNARALRAQAQSNLTFEVASVRRVEIPTTATGGVPVFMPVGGVGTSNPSRITYKGTWIPSLIAEAFGLRADQITGPQWLGTTRYDIDAKIPEGATEEQFNVMLRNLLRDRFNLRFHIESKVRPVYVLRVAKDGPKFKESAPVPSTEDAAPRSSVKGEDANGFPILPPEYVGMVGRPTPGQIFNTAQGYSMAYFARSLEQPAGRPVLDETGLTGRYDFKIRFAARRGPDAGVPSDPAPSIFDAVEQQLGLKLESASSSLDQLIIDSIDREPTEN
jgi:uncharacterized protein (TIGR03435 family)